MSCAIGSAQKERESLKGKSGSPFGDPDFLGLAAVAALVVVLILILVLVLLFVFELIVLFILILVLALVFLIVHLDSPLSPIV